MSNQNKSPAIYKYEAASIMQRMEKQLIEQRAILRKLWHEGSELVDGAYEDFADEGLANRYADAYKVYRNLCNGRLKLINDNQELYSNNTTNKVIKFPKKDLQ